MTSNELQAVLDSLKRMVIDDNGFLKKAEDELRRGNLIDSRIAMTRAIRQQIKLIKQYDTTGHLSSQAQHLEHVRTKLLKGTTKESIQNAFENFRQHSVDVDKGIGMAFVKFCGFAIGFGAWMYALVSGASNTQVANNVREGAMMASSLYGTVKAGARMLFAKEGRQHIKRVGRVIYEQSRMVADMAWKKTKEIGRKIATKDVKAVESGYKVVRRAASGVVETVKTEHEAVVTVSSTIGSTVANAGKKKMLSGVFRLFGLA